MKLETVKVKPSLQITLTVEEAFYIRAFHRVNDSNSSTLNELAKKVIEWSIANHPEGAEFKGFEHDQVES